MADCLADLVWRHGVPSHIIHDCTPELLSNVLQDTAAVFGLQQLPTSRDHPQTDGLVERLNQTLKSLLTKLVAKKGRDWDKTWTCIDGIQDNSPNINGSVAVVPIVWLRCQGAICSKFLRAWATSSY